MRDNGPAAAACDGVILDISATDWRRDAIDHAIQLLINGLAIVGGNARLYAALGHAHLQYREAGIDFSERPLGEGFPQEVRDTVPARLAQFLAYAFCGHQRDALAAVTPDLEAVATASDVFARFLAQGYAVAGVPERAVHWLTIAVDRGSINYPFLARYDPSFETVRSDPRFQQLLETVRERWLKFEA